MFQLSRVTVALQGNDIKAFYNYFSNVGFMLFKEHTERYKIIRSVSPMGITNDNTHGPININVKKSLRNYLGRFYNRNNGRPRQYVNF